MTDAAERTVEGDVLTSGATAPFATDVVVPADVAPADVVVPAVDSHNELVNVFGRRTQYKYVVAIVYVTALFLDILDTTIVNVAIPALGEQFQSGAAEWIVLGYTVSLAVWIPASGWLGDRFGTKRIFLFALASVHRRLAAVLDVDLDGAADPVPGPAGRRRWDAHAGRHRHAVPGLPARRAGQGRDDRDDPGAVPRRRAGPCSVACS